MKKMKILAVALAAMFTFAAAPAFDTGVTRTKGVSGVYSGTGIVFHVPLLRKATAWITSWDCTTSRWCSARTSRHRC